MPHSDKPLIGDIAGAGELINSEVVKRSYDDALSPTMRQVGALSEDLATRRSDCSPLPSN